MGGISGCRVLLLCCLNSSKLWEIGVIGGNMNLVVVVVECQWGHCEGTVRF